MSLTLSIDDHLARKARRVAGTLGKSLDELVRDDLRELTAREGPREAARELRRLSESDLERYDDATAGATFREWMREGWLTPPKDRSTEPPPRPAPVATMDEILQELAQDRADR